MIRACLAVALAAVPAIATAQRTVHAPLAAQLPLGTRSTAMGGGNAASRDAEGALMNPANVGVTTGLGVNLVRYRDGASGGVLGHSGTVGSMGVGISVSYLDYQPALGSPGIVSDAALVDPGLGTAASLAASAAMSLAWKGIRWGAAAIYLEERIETSRSGAAALSLGASKSAQFGFASFGLALQNIGPSLRYGESHVPLPTRLALGASGAQFPLNAWFDLGVDAGLSVRRDGLVGGMVGGELAWVPIEGVSAALRGGVRRPELKAQGPGTAGFGLSLDRFALDYAYEQMRSGGAHRIGLRVR
jgi:hypothetical protein